MSLRVTNRPDWLPAVREPIVREWNNRRVVATHGRNFIGRDSQVLRWIPKKIGHGIAAVSQEVLQFFPTLCSDIHVVACKE